MTPPQYPRKKHHTGQGAVTKALPYLMERVADERLPETALTPLEQAARAWRKEVELDLGGELAATKLALLDAATGTVILLAGLDRYVFRLAEKDGLVNKRSRRAFPVLEARMRLADSLTKQLNALGLERVKPPAPSLHAYLQQKYGERPGSACSEAPAGRLEPEPQEPEAQPVTRTSVK